MKNYNTYSLQFKDIYTSEKNIRVALNFSMIFRYILIIIACIFILLFHKNLPFPYPQFMQLVFAFLFVNIIIHIASLKKSLLRQSFSMLPYVDTGISFFIFQYTGGFLSPFILTHFITGIGSSFIYSNNKNLPKHLSIMLATSYLSIALLQKFGIFPCYIKYVESMMANDFFFFFIIAITTVLLGVSFLLVEMLNHHIRQLFDELTSTFDSILTGTISVIGQDFFVHLAKHLSSALKSQCVFIAELTNNYMDYHTLAISWEGKVLENFSSSFSNSLFPDIINSKKIVIEKNIYPLCVNNSTFTNYKPSFCFATLLTDSTGKPVGILCLASDTPPQNMALVEPLITIFASRASAELERKLAEDKRSIIELQLAHAHKMGAIGQLVSGIAHDFNNTLSAIIGFANILHSKLEPTSPFRQYAQRILDAGKTNAELVMRLTQFIRKGVPQVAPIDIHKVLDDTIALLERTISDNISIVKKYEATQSLSLGDVTLLQNVFMNIGINARDAMENNKGTITYATAISELKQSSTLCQSFQIPAGEYICITITDTGKGMNQEIQSHLFEPFFTTKQRGKGTGLGLANVWGYVENYKGAIFVQSAPGTGTSFSLYLPLAIEAHEQNSQPATLPDLDSPLTKKQIKNILIVDDEEAMREITAEILTENGYSINFCVDGVEAVDYIKKNHITTDLVLLDMIMPKKNGHDTFYDIRDIAPSMRVILISGLINENDLKGILTEKNTAFIQKPFTKELLLGEINKISSL